MYINEVTENCEAEIYWQGEVYFEISRYFSIQRTNPTYN